MNLNFNVGQNIFEQYTEFSDVNWLRVWEATKETMYMTFASVLVVFFLGILIVLILFETRNQEDLFSKILNRVVAFFVYVFRSVFFIILIVLLILFSLLFLCLISGQIVSYIALLIISFH